MTPENFEQFCKDICPQCEAGASTRFRPETQEWVHDTAVTIGVPGAIGKRMGHSFCLASNFRKKHKDIAGG